MLRWDDHVGLADWRSLKKAASRTTDDWTATKRHGATRHGVVRVLVRVSVDEHLSASGHRQTARRLPLTAAVRHRCPLQPWRKCLPSLSRLGGCWLMAVTQSVVIRPSPAACTASSSVFRWWSVNLRPSCSISVAHIRTHFTDVVTENNVLFLFISATLKILEDDNDDQCRRQLLDPVLFFSHSVDCFQTKFISRVRYSSVVTDIRRYTDQQTSTIALCSRRIEEWLKAAPICCPVTPRDDNPEGYQWLTDRPTVAIQSSTTEQNKPSYILTPAHQRRTVLFTQLTTCAAATTLQCARHLSQRKSLLYIRTAWTNERRLLSASYGLWLTTQHCVYLEQYCHREVSKWVNSHQSSRRTTSEAAVEWRTESLHVIMQNDRPHAHSQPRGRVLSSAWYGDIQRSLFVQSTT